MVKTNLQIERFEMADLKVKNQLKTKKIDFTSNRLVLSMYNIISGWLVLAHVISGSAIKAQHKASSTVNAGTLFFIMIGRLTFLQVKTYWSILQARVKYYINT